jgi:hypothetical protein
MRLAKSSRTLFPLALSAILATCALAQEHPNVQPSAVRDQVMKQVPAEPQPPSAPQSPAASAAKSSTPTKAKGPAKRPAKAPATAKDSTKVASVEKPAAEKPVVRRDPFDTLLTRARPSNSPPENLPPGKAGLIVETLRINGIVHSANGMIAVVSNSQQRVYFLREGDKLYDGSVEKIELEGISFKEIGKDAFGKPLERVVTKRLYPTPGEQK